MNEFSGSWIRRGGVLVPVMPDEKPPMLCRVCGSPCLVEVCRPCKDSSRQRVHGSHAGWNQHQRRNEPPCQACSDAEKTYQGKRYRRGQMSTIDRAWCERQAVKWSWIQDTRTHRTCDTLSQQREEPP